MFSVLWNIEMRADVNRSYCYTSDGSGAWERLPRDTSIFFEGADGAYTQLIRVTRNVQINVACWGWVGDELEFLGDGHAAFDIAEPPASVVIRGGGFDLTGTLTIPSLPPAVAGVRCQDSGAVRCTQTA